MVKVSLVSYLNSIPFKWGLEYYLAKPEFELSFDYPAECARKLIAGEVDVGLVPLAVITEVKNAQIISPFGIGADGKVDSVLLVGNKPLEDIKIIWLDYQSKSSINLLRVLLENYWKNHNITLKPAAENYLDNLKENEAAVVIGDRALMLKENYNYVWDLAEEWKKFTHLPFVFAAWVSNTTLPEPWIKNFNDALRYGLDNIENVITNSQTPLSTELKRDYLKNKIKYRISSEPYQNAISQFLSFLRSMRGY